MSIPQSEKIFLIIIYTNNKINDNSIELNINIYCKH